MRDSLHFVGVTGEVRERALPDVPTLKEQGFAVTPIDQMWFAQTSPKTPQDRVDVLAGAFAKAFADKALFEQMAKAGEFPRLLSGAEVSKRVVQQTQVIEKFKDIFS
jgi:tripartite-type tricarboxylate transporter receptor subunit TctC